MVNKTELSPVHEARVDAKDSSPTIMLNSRLRWYMLHTTADSYQFLPLTLLRLD
jgi:hypothetical protein